MMFPIVTVHYSSKGIAETSDVLAFGWPAYPLVYYSLPNCLMLSLFSGALPDRLNRSLWRYLFQPMRCYHPSRGIPSSPTPAPLPASCLVLSLWHSMQSGCRFSLSFVPPLYNGTMWSISCAGLSHTTHNGLSSNTILRINCQRLPLMRAWVSFLCLWLIPA
jgi:hypothetical protein